MEQKRRENAAKYLAGVNNGPGGYQQRNQISPGMAGAMGQYGNRAQTPQNQPQYGYKGPSPNAPNYHFKPEAGRPGNNKSPMAVQGMNYEQYQYKKQQENEAQKAHRDRMAQMEKEKQEAARKQQEARAAEAK